MQGQYKTHMCVCVDRKEFRDNETFVLISKYLNVTEQLAKN